jgi:uncharacterized membrane protein YebE (DUF533 family)
MGGIESIQVENKTSGIILRILNLMALADGSVSPEEENLLETLLDRYRLHNKLSSWESDFENSNDVEALAAAIFTNEDRCLAIKLAYMVAAVSKNSEDEAAINSEESKIYRKLIENLGLPQATIEIIEQEADVELAKQPSLWQILYGAFGNLNYWPESGVIPVGPWLHF